MSKEIILKGRGPDGQEVPLRGDAKGREMKSFVYFDITSTGSATLTRAQETTIIAGVASTFLDVVRVSGSNSSGVAQSVSIRIGTANGVQDTIVVPATSTTNVTYYLPIPASEAASAVTAQNVTAGEASDSPVTITIGATQRTSSSIV